MGWPGLCSHVRWCRFCLQTALLVSLRVARSPLPGPPCSLPAALSSEPSPHLGIQRHALCVLASPLGLCSLGWDSCRALLVLSGLLGPSRDQASLADSRERALQGAAPLGQCLEVGADMGPGPWTEVSASRQPPMGPGSERSTFPLFLFQFPF